LLFYDLGLKHKFPILFYSSFILTGNSSALYFYSHFLFKCFS